MGAFTNDVCSNLGEFSKAGGGGGGGRSHAGVSKEV